MSVEVDVNEILKVLRDKIGQLELDNAILNARVQAFAAAQEAQQMDTIPPAEPVNGKSQNIKKDSANA